MFYFEKPQYKELDLSFFIKAKNRKKPDLASWTDFFF